MTTERSGRHNDTSKGGGKDVSGYKLEAEAQTDAGGAGSGEATPVHGGCV